jgi:hypothetical protein
LFNILFERRLNGLEDYKETLAITMNTPAFEARAKDMGEIVFPTIGVRKDVKRKYEDKNKERERNQNETKKKYF